MLRRRGESCFFADLCLILPLTNRPEADITLLNSILQGGNCFISSSVRERFDYYLNSVYDYILSDLRDNLPQYLQRCEVTEVSAVDGLIFESFFAERRRQLRKEPFESRSLCFMLESYIENWIVSEVHSLDRSKKMKIENFLSAIYHEISNKYEELKSPVESIELVAIVPKAEIRAIALRQGVVKFEDQDHIASLLEYQYTKDKWVIFLTYDEKHMLNNADRLRKNCAIYISKPIYAFDHQRELSKETGPVDFLRGISDLTPAQKKLIEVLQNTLGVKVTP